MLIIIGYIIIIVSVFGGFYLSGGNLAALFQPFEFIIITGAAIGAFIIGNSFKVIKLSIKSAFMVIKGGNYSKKFYIELLSLFFVITNKIKKDGVLSIEADIEDYKKSPLFNQYKLVMKEQKIMEFFCDHLRLIVTGRVEVMHLEQLMDEDIETFEHEAELAINAITKVADSMPAFGIVAAVMGVVTTMQKINGPPEELGAHVAAALVGTFLGILIGYGFTAPIASILETRLHSQLIILQSMKLVLLVSAHQLAPSIAVEFARKVLYSGERPTNNELEKILKDIRSGSSSSSKSENETEKAETA